MPALRDIMTSDVFSISRDTPVAEAARAMVKGRFGSAIVSQSRAASAMPGRPAAKNAIRQP